MVLCLNHYVNSINFSFTLLHRAVTFGLKPIKEGANGGKLLFATDKPPRKFRNSLEQIFLRIILNDDFCQGTVY